MTAHVQAMKALDVLSYEPADGNMCREGTAIVIQTLGEQPIAIDTFWASSHRDLIGASSWSFWNEAHHLTAAELATAVHQYNLADYRLPEPTEDLGSFDDGMTVCVTAQHAHTKLRFVKIGAERSNHAILQRQRILVAQKERSLEVAREDLARELAELDRLTELHQAGEDL